MPEIKDNSAADNSDDGTSGAVHRPASAEEVGEARGETGEAAKAREETAEAAKAPEETAEAAKAPEETAEAAKAPEETGEAAKAPEEKARPAKSTRRARRTVRRRWPVVLSGTATLVLVAAAVGAGSFFPGTDATIVTEPVPHLLPVGESWANCQGPTQLLAGSAAGADPDFSANSSSTSTVLNAVVLSGSAGQFPGSAVQSLDGSFTPLLTVARAPADPAPTPTELTGEPKLRAVMAQKSMDAPSALSVQPLGEEVPQGAGSVVVDADDGDLAGLAAATCQTPSNEMWLSGASTAVGRTAVLAVSNSSQSPATVSLELFGSNGPVKAAGGNDLVVAAGAVRSVVLSGLAPDQDMLSVHLKSTGGAVSAVIQQSVLRGLTPGGVDYLAPVQAPSSSLNIPGVRVQAPADADRISGQSGYADASAVLAVTVPGAGDAVVEVKAHGPEGQVALPNGGVFTATAGQVSELSLAGLPRGTYSLSVSADAAVVATARLVNSTGVGEAVDLAFTPSAGRLGTTHLVTLPKDVSSSLVFTAPEGPATVSLVPISAGGGLGGAQTVELTAGSTKTIDPSALLGSGAASVLVSVSGAPAYGTQLLLKPDSAGIAILPITGTTAGTHSVNITTGY